MSNPLVLIDFSNVAQTCWHPAIAAHEAGEEAWKAHQTGCIVCSEGTPCPTAPRRYDVHEVFKTNLGLKVGTMTEDIRVPVNEWVMVEDGRPKARYEKFPEYKGNRERKDDYGDPRPAAKEFFRQKGCRFVRAEEYEADDVIATLAVTHATAQAAKSSQDECHVIIVSSDRDLWQVWTPPFIRIYSPTLKLYISRERIEKAFQVHEPHHIRLCKALWGDTSDNLPNAVPRMQKQLLPLIQTTDGTLASFLARLANADLTPRCRELLKAGMQAVETNYFVAGLMPVDTAKLNWTAPIEMAADW